MYDCKDIIYTYDGTFNGLMCCVYESVYNKEIPVKISCISDGDLTFYAIKEIETDCEKAGRVYSSIYKKISSHAAELVKTVYLTCADEKELIILRFLMLGYKQGKKTTTMVAHKYVAPMLAAQRAIKSEVHKLKGFIRFTQVDDALVANINPKNNVLPFLKSYFCARYAKSNFLIYDKTNGLALIYENSVAKIVCVESLSMPNESEEEKFFKSLWVRYYKTIAIKSRKNDKCRMSLMPKRYWRNMPEVADELNANSN